MQGRCTLDCGGGGLGGEAGEAHDVPAGEVCQEGPLLAGHEDQQVDGEDDA